MNVDNPRSAGYDGRKLDVNKSVFPLSPNDPSYREWNIVGQYEVPGFFYLKSRFRLNPGGQLAIYTDFELCIHECQFERAQV
jgi:hypothetical protein